MGIAALHESSCNFPGIGKIYDPVIDQPMPVAPKDIGNPPSNPVLPTSPLQPGQNATQGQMSTYLQALNTYQTQVNQIQANYQNEMSTYQQQADAYKAQENTYQQTLTDWNVKRNAAVGNAEAIIKVSYTDFSWAFVNKKDPAAYWKMIGSTWISQGMIILVLVILSILLIWRKDRAA